MLATKVRNKPCNCLEVRDSSRRLTVSVSPSWDKITLAGSSRESSPFGPLTVTLALSKFTWTFAGTVIGRLPIRDITLSLLLVVCCLLVVSCESAR